MRPRTAGGLTDPEGPNVVEQGGAMSSSRRATSQTRFDFAYEVQGVGHTSAGRSTSSAPAQKPTLHQPHVSLMERILSSANLTAAWRRVVRNRGAAGVDGMKVEELLEHWRRDGARIRASLLDGSYQPSPVRRVSIPKASGGERVLGIPTVLDRLIQQAVLQVLTPIFDPGFSASSFGFRPGRSAHGAVKRVAGLYQQGYRVAIDMDLEKFFDRVQHDVLMRRVARKVDDKRVLRLIGRYLRAGAMDGDVVIPRGEGTPQGGPLSPLLANILLDDLDKELESRGLRFSRYADDFLIVTRSWLAARRVKASVTRWLDRHLRLKVNEAKSKVARLSECAFLGFRIHHKGTIRIAKASFERFRRRVRELTGRSRGISMTRRVRELNRYTRGWARYFSLAVTKTPFRSLDRWIRRRLRMCYWKQWRRPKTRIRNLLALGAPKDLAVKVGVSRKGPWRLAKTLGTHHALDLAFLRRLGLVSISDIWKRCAPLR